MAVAVLLCVITVMGFVLACLALRQVRPAWFTMRASLGRWTSFSIEMEARQERHPAVPRSAPVKTTGGSE